MRLKVPDARSNVEHQPPLAAIRRAQIEPVPVAVRVVHRARRHRHARDLALDPLLRSIQRARRHVHRLIEHGSLPLHRGPQQQPRLVRRSRAQLRDAQPCSVRRSRHHLSRVRRQNPPLRPRQIVLRQFRDGFEQP